MSNTIGIFGGTFSPPHLGHIHAAKAFVCALKLEKLLVIPSFIPPQKEVTSPVSGEDRLAMCKLAFSDLPCAEVSDIELLRQGKSYTVDTLKQLKNMYPNANLAFLMGTDMMLTLDQWYAPDEVFALCDLYCVRRETDATLDEDITAKNEEYLKRFGKRVNFISVPSYEISSTEVRESIAEGREIESLPSNVARYIESRGLYR